MKIALTKTQCKDKVAQDCGYENWYDAAIDSRYEMMDAVLDLYALQTRIVAAEQAFSPDGLFVDQDSIINPDLTSIEK